MKETKKHEASSRHPTTVHKDLKDLKDPKSGMHIVAKYNAISPAIDHIGLLLGKARASKSSSAGALSACFDIDDTLVFDDGRETPNVQVRFLLDICRAHGCKIHLITARERDPSVVKWTRDQLRRHGVLYTTLSLAPKKARESMSLIANWKHSERERHKPFLSVGDQWGDLINLKDVSDIDALDKEHNVEHTPWILMKPMDNVTTYGFKLLAPR